MTTPLSGPSSNLTPDYSRQVDYEQAKKGSSQRIGSGARLAKDSLEIPFEKHAAIETHELDASRPFLAPLFRTRFVDDLQGEDLSRDYYKTLRDSLPPMLKGKLEQDETQLNPEDRDPDMIALDSSLRFEANLLALADTLSVPSTGNEKILRGAQQYLALPNVVKEELKNYGKSIVNYLDHHLSEIGPNDPSYEILKNVSNQIKEGLHLLHAEHENLEQ